MKLKKKTFEEAFSELENLTSNMENENLELEKYLEYYKKANELINFCEKILSNASQKITNIN